nr:unnamed protein product [Callosobruchus analis]
MAVWNIKNLALPPIATYKTNSKDIDVIYLRQVCKDAKHFFEDKRYMHVEYLILSRIVYRMKQKFRSSKDFKAVVKMYKTLDNYFKINMSAYINTFMELIPHSYEDEGTYLPTKNLIDFILVRHQGLVKLLVRIVETSKLAAYLLQERIHIGHSWQCAFTLFAIASRIYVLSKFMIQKTCDFYQKLYPFSNKLMNLGVDWLKSDNQLPKDLRQWLNIDWLDVDDEVKIIEEPELPRIIDFFDLVNDDDDDVQFCDEYIVLDESLINVRGNKKHTHMVDDSIKILRGFDLEDEGEVIEVCSEIQETPHIDDSIKIIDKSLTTITVNDTICPLLDETKHDDDNANSSLTFGNISTIANDTMLNESNIGKFHSTALSPDEHNVTLGIHSDNLLVPQSKGFDSQNVENVCETLPSALSMRHLEERQNLHNSKAVMETNSSMPANVSTLVELLDKDVTIVPVSDTVCSLDKSMAIDDEDVGVDLSLENNNSHDLTVTKKNVNVVYTQSKKVSNNECLSLSKLKGIHKDNENTKSTDLMVMRPSEVPKKKRQNGTAGIPQIKSKLHKNTLPSTSKVSEVIENKKQKNFNTPSTPIRRQSNSSNYNKIMNAETLNCNPKYALKNNDTNNASDFNVTLPTGYIVLSDSDDSDTILSQNSVIKQEPKKSKYASENDCSNSYLEDGWYIDINKSEISPNTNYVDMSLYSRTKNKKRKKKRPAGDLNLAVTPLKRTKLDRHPNADTTKAKKKKLNNESHLKVNSKRNKRGKRRRYYNMKIAE